MALARELKEELGARCKSVPIGRTSTQVRRQEDLEILFYAVEIEESESHPRIRTNCVGASKELGAYDFLAANAQLVAQLATAASSPRNLESRARNRRLKRRTK